MGRNILCVFVKSGQNAALLQIKGTNMDNLASYASVKLQASVPGSQTNRAIGTMETLLFPNKLCAITSPENTHRALKWGTKEGEAANSKQATIGKEKPSWAELALLNWHQNSIA